MLKRNFIQIKKLNCPYKNFYLSFKKKEIQSREVSTYDGKRKSFKHNGKDFLKQTRVSLNNRR